MKYSGLLFVGMLVSLGARAESCAGAGPQSPRDITSAAGSNPRVLSPAPASSQMNLCNIHFHQQAEHRGPGFSAGPAAGEHGGYQCNAGAATAPSGDPVCESVRVGDTVEVHWVFTTCDVDPGPGLGSCLAANCSNPQLRVETQVFEVTSEGGLDFDDFDYAASQTAPFRQPQALPGGTGAPVTYAGSTTGPSYSGEVCSPLQVTWSVRPECAALNVESLGRWCESNPFEESQAHGVRELVTNPDLLSPIVP